MQIVLDQATTPSEKTGPATWVKVLEKCSKTPKSLFQLISINQGMSTDTNYVTPVKTKGKQTLAYLGPQSIF